MPTWTNHGTIPLEIQITPSTWHVIDPGDTALISNSLHGINLASVGTHIPLSQPEISIEPGSINWATDWNSIPFASPTPPPLNSLANYILQSKKEPEMTPKDIEFFYNRRISQVVNFKSGLLKGDIGLEIECEGTHLFNSPFSYWTCHADGSLRETGGHPPIEYVLKAPLPVPEVKEALEYLSSKLKEAGSKLVKSNRTSVHVHVNCQQLTIRELYCFLCMYLIFEELLVDWSGPERAGNLFCLRAKDSGFYINMLEGAIKNQSFKQWREDFRYSACNVASITKFGSLEFRSMQGTVNVEEIQTWVEILMMIKNVSLEYDNPIDIVEEFTTIGPLPFFKKIFKHDEFRKLFERVDGLSGKLWDGLRLMRDVAYCCEWKPYIKKKQTKMTSLKSKLKIKT